MNIPEATTWRHSVFHVMHYFKHSYRSLQWPCKMKNLLVLVYTIRNTCINSAFDLVRHKLDLSALLLHCVCKDSASAAWLIYTWYNVLERVTLFSSSRKFPSCFNVHPLNIAAFYTERCANVLRMLLALCKQERCGAHTPCAALQLHAARQLLICFVYEHVGVTCISTCTGDAQLILQEEKGSAVVVICSHCMYFIYCLFVTLWFAVAIASFISWSIANVRMRVCERIWRMHMQIIAVGVTNRRDQQKARLRCQESKENARTCVKAVHKGPRRR